MDIGYVLVILGSVPLVLIGAALLALPGRRRDTVLLGAFLVAWAGGALAANTLGDPFLAPLVGLLFFAPAGAFILAFAVRSSPRARLAPWLAAYAAAIAVNLGLAYALRLPIDDAMSMAASTYFIAFAGALLIVYREYTAAEPGSRRRRYRELLVPLVIFPGYVSALGTFSSHSLRVVEFLLPLLCVVGILVHAIVRPVRPDGRDPMLLVALAVPLALGIVTALTDSVSEFGLAGVARLATAGLLAYAIARRHLFDVDLRLKRLIGPAAALLAVGYGGAAALAARTWWPFAVGAGVGLMAFALRRDLGRLVVRGPVGDPEYVRVRKMEVYRAGLEAAMAGGIAADSPELKRMRRSFGISEDDHARILAERGTTTRRTQTPRVVLGRYKLERVLGEGAHGRTHLARDMSTGQEVAVKITRDAVRESETLKRVTHANVVRVLDAGEEDDRALLVMEYAAGGSLHGLLRRRGALPREDAARMLAGILDGLAACHAAGIVHRDVKPENVLLTTEGDPKLADFGIAREARIDATGLTAGGAGTLLYMAPEQVRGQPADARSDLYAAAVIFHQMLTRRHYLAIAGRDDFQIRALILDGAPELALPPGLADVEPFLRVGLQKDPDMRYQSAAEMRRALGGLLRDDIASAHQPVVAPAEGA